MLVFDEYFIKLTLNTGLENIFFSIGTYIDIYIYCPLYCPTVLIKHCKLIKY